MTRGEALIVLVAGCLFIGASFDRFTVWRRWQREYSEGREDGYEEAMREMADAAGRAEEDAYEADPDAAYEEAWHEANAAPVPASWEPVPGEFGTGPLLAWSAGMLHVDDVCRAIEAWSDQELTRGRREARLLEEEGWAFVRGEIELPLTPRQELEAVG